MEQNRMDALVRQITDRLFVELEASGRHVHLTGEQSRALFGHGLTPERPLSQPGQFLARERVTLVGPKGTFENVAVLGPERKEAQIEVSLTDARQLGLQAPVRLSGEVGDTPGIRIRGESGTVELARGVMAARRHIHLSPEAAARFGVVDGQTVRLQTFTERPVIFADVAVRVSPAFAPYAHLDYDEANACGLKKGDLGRILP